MSNNQDDASNKKCDDTDNCTTCNFNKCNGHPDTNSEPSQPKSGIVNAKDYEDNNIDEMNLDARFCYACDSFTDTNCESHLETSMLERCPKTEEDLGCFHAIKGNNIFSGECSFSNYM